ncbi:UNVERIFIED_CONTAM: hypothetical protein FKN15_031975 [Acipenser sinensis]
MWNVQFIIFIPVHRCNPPATGETEDETRVLRNVFLPILSFFALRIRSDATRPIVPEDNTDLNGSTADLRRLQEFNMVYASHSVIAYSALTALCYANLPCSEKQCPFII